jgi:hypothetical protein
MLSLLLVPCALAAPPALNLIPFGVGVYLHDRPVRGVVYSVTQAAGVAGLTAATVLTKQAGDENDVERVGQLGTVTAASVSVLAASYIVSVFDGGRLHELEQERARKATADVRAWDEARARVGTE